MSREYTFNNRVTNITVNDVDVVINNLIKAEKILMGRNFDHDDYTIVLGDSIADIVRCFPDTIDFHDIVWCSSPNILPTCVSLRRINKSLKQVKTNKGYVAPVMSLTHKQNLIKDVIFNDPATIVYWVDGTKTVVKAHNEKFDPEKGLAMAICKRFLGSNKSGSNFNNIFKKWLPEQKESNSDTNIKDYEKNEPLRWMTVAEVAEELGCSKALVQEECRKGLYPGAFKENGKWLIPVPLLEEKRGNKNE